jgi:hypothetical protein
MNLRENEQDLEENSSSVFNAEKENEELHHELLRHSG